MKFTFRHNNINVLNLEKSIEFYQKALGLYVERRKKGSGFELVFLSDKTSGHNLELTYLEDRTAPYNLGDNEIHLAFSADDFKAAYALHKEMGCICYENEKMGIYFITDPDGYWIEIVPVRQRVLKHIVFWKFKDGAEGLSRNEIMQKVQDMLLALIPQIPEIKSMEIGGHIACPEDKYDMALYTTFDDETSLLSYKVHPRHVEVSDFVKLVSTDRACVDFYE